MKVMQGIVTAVKREKTVTVMVTSFWRHPLYLKSVKRSKKYACHFENLTLMAGDMVEIKETKPVSKTKRFIVTKKVKA